MMFFHSCLQALQNRLSGISTDLEMASGSAGKNVSFFPILRDPGLHSLIFTFSSHTQII